MRRLAAAIGLAWINFTLIFMAISPVFGAPSSNLPMCCRRGGKHACSLASQSPAGGTGFQSARCPLYPGSRALPAQSKVNAVAISATSTAVAANPTELRPQTEIRYRVSYSRAGQKRGPPVSLA